MMVESYKVKSRLANILVFVAGLVSYIGVDGLRTVIPEGYANFIPIIVMIAGYIVVQSTEDKRVAVAEELVHDVYQQGNDDYSTTATLNDEYGVDEDDNRPQ